MAVAQTPTPTKLGSCRSFGKVQRGRARLSLFAVEAGDGRSTSKRETNVKCRRSLAREGTISYSPGSAVTTAVCPSLSEPKAEKFFLVKISLFGTS
jgi:hypothetical protein